MERRIEGNGWQLFDADCPRPGWLVLFERLHSAVNCNRQVMKMIRYDSDASCSRHERGSAMVLSVKLVFINYARLSFIRVE